MYVEDIDDLDELKDMLAEAEDRLDRALVDREQARWNVEDIQGRIDDIEQEREL